MTPCLRRPQRQTALVRQRITLIHMPIHIHMDMGMPVPMPTALQTLSWVLACRMAISSRLGPVVPHASSVWLT